MIKHLIFLLTLSILCRSISFAQETETNCGINSALSLATTFVGVDSTVDPSKYRGELSKAYPNAEVSLLDVKSMCERVGIDTVGVKGTLQDILGSGSPSIVGLKSPSHFLVLLDGDGKSVRAMDGANPQLVIIDRSDLEKRFTGFALLPKPRLKPNSPKLVTPTFDKNVVFQGVGQLAEFHFPVKNGGASKLKFRIASTSCGCTSARLGNGNAKEVVLAPGKSTDLVLSYRVQSQSAIQQSATILSNDPSHPTVFFSIRGQLPTQLTLSPPALFIEGSHGLEQTKSFKVIGPSGTKVKKIWSDLPYLSFAPQKIELSSGTSVTPIEVSGFSTAPLGPLNGRIHIQLNDGREFFVQVRGEIDGDLPGSEQAAQLPRAEDDHESPMGSPLPTVKVGDVAPDFNSDDSDGKLWHLSDLRGKKSILLTFFPRCFTGGCANHLSGLRDHQTEFDAARTQILAVSVDPADGEKGQKAFADQWKFTFPMIPDTARVLSNLYGATQNPDERDARMTFLIDKQGIVRYIATNVNVQTHGADMLAKIKELGLDK